MRINKLFDFLSGFYPLSGDLKKYLTNVTLEEYYMPHQVIHSEGQIPQKIWFILEGCAMNYIFKEDRKIPYGFWYKGEIMASVYSFIRQEPDDGYIELLEESALISISYNHLEYAFKTFPETEKLARLYMSYSLHLQEIRTKMFTVSSAKERYEYLNATYPSIFRNVQSDHIAAYLGVSRKTLTRLRTNRGKDR